MRDPNASDAEPRGSGPGFILAVIATGVVLFVTLAVWLR
jgi:hypothetical protein